MFRRGDRRGARQSRRRGGGTPIDPNLAILLNSGALAFFDPDWEDGLALRQSGDDLFVTAMQDRINGHVVAQGTDANQPLWGALSPTGRRMMTFDSDQILTTVTDAIASAADGNDPVTVYAVVLSGVIPTAGNVAFWGFGNSGSTSRMVMQQLGGSPGGRVSITRTDTSNGSTNNLESSGLFSGDLQCATVQYDGSHVAAWLDGSAVNLSGGANSRTIDVDSFSIGGSIASGTPERLVTGEIAGVLVLAGVHTQGDREATEAALMAYYGVTV